MLMVVCVCVFGWLMCNCFVSEAQAKSLPPWCSQLYPYSKPSTVDCRA